MILLMNRRLKRMVLFSLRNDNKIFAVKFSFFLFVPLLEIYK